MITRHNCLTRENGVSVNVCKFERTTLNRPDCQVCDYWQTDKTKMEVKNMANYETCKTENRGALAWDVHPEQYRKNKTCAECGVRVHDCNKSGYCIKCSGRRNQKLSPSGIKFSKTKQAKPETKPVILETKPVMQETISPKPETRRNPDTDILAIESVICDAKKWRQIEPFISQIMDMAKQLQDVMDRRE